MILSNPGGGGGGGGGGTQMLFGRGCEAEASKPVPIFKGHLAERVPIIRDFFVKKWPIFKGHFAETVPINY